MVNKCRDCMDFRELEDGRYMCFIRSMMHVFFIEPDEVCGLFQKPSNKCDRSRCKECVQSALE